jgi:hypothetical protein
VCFAFFSLCIRVSSLTQLDSQARAAGVAISQLYFACGSGGTAAGLALGLGLLKQQQQQPQEEQTTSHSSSASPKSKRASSAGGTANGRSGSSVLGLGGAELVALGVDDSPEDFYNKIEAIHNDMGKEWRSHFYYFYNKIEAIHNDMGKEWR